LARPINKNSKNKKLSRDHSKHKRSDKLTLAVIPCYNEEITIGSIVIRTARYVDNVLVVDDGSIDDTARTAKQAGAIVISHKDNKGKSSGIKTGFRYALNNGYDYVVTIDGDGQHNPNEIPALLKNVVNSGNDISIGLRCGDTTEMPKWRRVGKRVLDYVTSFANGGYVTDSQCGFRAFNKKAVKSLLPRLNGGGFNAESEELIKAHDLGLKIVSTKVACKYKNLDTSTKNPASHALSVLKYVVYLVAERRPLLFIGIPGFVLIIIGLIMGIYTLQRYNQTGMFPILQAILISIFLVLGTLAVFIGLVLNVLPNIIKRLYDGELQDNYHFI